MLVSAYLISVIYSKAPSEATMLAEKEETEGRSNYYCSFLMKLCPRGREMDSLLILNTLMFHNIKAGM